MHDSQEIDLRPLMIRASAGTGKTRSLTNRYLSLILRGEKLEHILATTFTRKAAFEIQQRIIERLSQAAKDSKQCKELAVDTGIKDLSSGQVRQILKYVLNNLHRLEISTIDSFVAKIVMAYEFELGLRPGWMIEDDSGLVEIYRESLAKVCSEIESPLLRSLLDIIARDNARRGVSLVLEDQLNELLQVFEEAEDSAWFWMVGKGSYPSESSLAKAQESIASIELPITKKGTPVVHWENAIRKLKQALENQDYQEIINNSLLQNVQAGLLEFSRREINDQHRQALAPVAYICQQMILQKQEERSKSIHAILSVYRSAYRALQNKAQIFTFNDLKRLFRNFALSPALDNIYFRLDCRINHLLLDEFQDTSIDEWSVLQPMVAEILSKASGDASFFCVGDVKQAIYGWRGGVAEIFDEISTGWKQIEEINFNQSYRCSSEVINLVNLVFSSLGSNPALNNLDNVRSKWKERYIEHTAVRSDCGYVLVKEFDKQVEEFAGLSALLPELRSILKDSESASIGILLRSNTEVVDCIAYLNEALPDVVLSQEGGKPIKDFPFVNLIICLFELIDYPADSIAAFKVKHSPLAEFNKKANLYKMPVKQYVLVLREQLMVLGYPHFLQIVLNKLLSFIPESQQAVASRLLLHAHQFSKDSFLRPAKFSEWIKRQKFENTREARIRVMTIHQSKGLEFDAVFLPALDIELKGQDSKVADILRQSALLPAERICLATRKEERAFVTELEEARKSSQDERIIESLSLLYVALTRARHALYLALAEDSESAVTFAGVVAGAVTCKGLPYEKGDRACLFDAGKEKSEVKSTIIKAPIQLKKHEKKQRGFQREAPSVTGREDFVLPDLSSTRSRRFGIKVHKKLQNILWLPIGERVLDFNSKQISELFYKETYETESHKKIDVKTEYAFARLTGDHLQTGYIDRLVLAYDVDDKLVFAEIIDFKTDKVIDKLQIEQRSNKYCSQLKEYKEAISEVFGLNENQINTKLVFLEAGSVVDLKV